ncbi:hypothetical protein ACIBCD_42590 [Nocardia brasiliensis]|uniref:hypothetical protein n=1 Tax=Nocardia brasiliensis TaxID=37326 RepID=UPI0037B3B445
MKDLAAEGIPVAETFRVLRLARPLHCLWRARTRDRPARSAEAYRANALFGAHRDYPEFGYRFLAGEARAACETHVQAYRVTDLLDEPVVECIRQRPPRQEQQAWPAPA